jgi:hypothetical protein
VLSYAVLFRAGFCLRMRWRVSGQIAISELAANSLLPASGAGGLAPGAWALNRGGMSAEQVGRNSVAMLSPRLHVKLAERLPEVLLDRARTDEQSIGDLPAAAGGRQHQLDAYRLGVAGIGSHWGTD